MRKHAQHVLRFSLVGVVNTLVDFFVYLVLAWAGVPPFVANLISTSCGLLTSYFGNRYFTFKVHPTGRRSAALQLAKFILVTGVGLWIIQPLVIWGAAAVLAGFHPTEILHIAIPKAAAIAVALVWNFLMFKAVVFRPTAAAADDSRSES